MTLPQAKHDALFRLIVSDPGHAGAPLQDYLPPDIAARLDLDSPPEHVEGTAIDGEGRKTEADHDMEASGIDRDQATTPARLIPPGRDGR